MMEKSAVINAPKTKAILTQAKETSIPTVSALFVTV